VGKYKAPRNKKEKIYVVWLIGYGKIVILLLNSNQITLITNILDCARSIGFENLKLF